MAKREQARTPRKKAPARPAKAAKAAKAAKPARAASAKARKASTAGSRRVTKARSESGAVRRPRRGGGEGKVPPEETVSPEAEAAEAPAAEQPEAPSSPLPPGEGQGEAAVSPAPGPAGPGAVPPERRAEAERVVRELLGHMGFAARLELKDAPDGGLAMAVHFEGEPPAGVQAGRRTPVMDALQFIANKLFNKPGMERRWLALAPFAFPEPRVPGAKKPAPAAAPQAPAAPAPQAAAQAAAQPAAQAPARPARPERPARGGEADERTLEVAEDAALAQEARLLAERAAKHGRFFAVLGMDAENRARVVRASAGVAGVRVHLEGEGRHRRVVFSPEKPTPLPKRNVLPDWDDEDEDV